MLRTTIALVAVLGIAAAALAADDILRLRTGKIVVGQITALNESGVTLRTENGEARFDWTALTPLCEYEIREERLDEGDAKGRVELAELCLGNGLYPYARRELDTARGLGFQDLKRLDELEDAVNQAEADEAFARIEQLMAEQEYRKALAEVTRFVKQAPESDYTRKARAMAPDILRRIDAQKLREEEEEKQAEEDERSKAKAEKLTKLLASAAEYREKAATSFSSAVREHMLGKTSRAEKSYLASEKSLLKAHHTLRKVQSSAGRGVTYDKATEGKDAIKTKLVEVYLGLARLKIEHRNYKRGIVYVNRALYLDPVNKEALELRKEVDENRIRRSARKLTNTPPVRTSGR